MAAEQLSTDARTMILNQPDFFARSATLDGAISDTDTQITLSGLSTRFTDAVAAGTVRYPIGPFRISDDDGFELIAITGHVSGTTFEVERGIQGTSEEAWPDETAVRAVVTREQLVDRRVVQSQIVKQSPRLEAFDDFDRADGTPSTMPTGQAYEIFGSQGVLQISNTRLLNTSGSSDRSFLLWPTTHVDYEHTIKGRTAQGRKVGVVAAWQNVNNYVYCEWLSVDSNTRYRIDKVVDGEQTTLASNELSNIPFLDRGGVYRIRMNAMSDGGQLIMRVFNTNIRNWNDDDVRNTIMPASTHVGVFLDGGADMEYYSAYRGNAG